MGTIPVAIILTITIIISLPSITITVINYNNIQHSTTHMLFWDVDGTSIYLHFQHSIKFLHASCSLFQTTLCVLYYCLLRQQCVLYITFYSHFPQAVHVIWYLRNVIESNRACYSISSTITRTDESAIFP